MALDEIEKKAATNKQTKRCCNRLVGQSGRMAVCAREQKRTAQKCAFLTKIHIKEKLPHDDNTPRRVNKISIRCQKQQIIDHFQRDFPPSSSLPTSIQRFSVTPLDIYYSAFDGVMTTTIVSLLLLSSIVCMRLSLCVCVLFSQIFPTASFFLLLLIVKYSLSPSLVNYRAVCRHTKLCFRSIERTICVRCAIHSNTHTVGLNVDIAFGDQYTHRDRSTNTPCY